jgi:hypothetical protein
MQRLQTDNDEVLIPTSREENKCKITKWLLIFIIVFFVSFEAIVGFSYYVSSSNQVPID